MSNSVQCARCGGELPANFPQGVCPACLLQQGLSPSTFMSGASSPSGSRDGGRRRSWTPPTPAELAPRFPQLEIVELLGQGGMGAVYKVRQKELDRWAALKVLPDEVAHDPNFSERFLREARALALLGHQHIVTVYEFGQRDGVFFLLMEYIDGVTLRQAIRAGQISSREALGIVTQICDALQFAHEEGVVHRDIKPENILIDKRGRVKIADFGLAKLLGRSIEVPTLTGTHQVMGTPVYMAPEQMEGKRGVDHRADIFSLGVVFYELLTGELPLGRFAPPSQKYRLDVRLDEVVLRTLEKEPDRRYQQASDVKGDVESIRCGPVVAASVKVKKPRRIWRVAKIGVVLTAVAFFSYLAMCFVSLHQVFRQVESQRNNYALEINKLRSTLAQQQEFNRQEISQSSNSNIKESSKPASDDSNLALAIVQFAAEGAKLNPGFGTSEFSDEHRQIVNQILTKTHQAYLAIESRYTSWDVLSDGTQVATIGGHTDRSVPNASDKMIVTINRFAEEISKLENDLWTEIDSKLPIHEQKFLRHELPLYSNDRETLRVVQTDVMNMSGMGLGMGMPAGGSSSLGGGSMAGMGGTPGMGGMGGPPVHSSQFTINLRYEQLLGWKIERRANGELSWDAGSIPIRVSIGHRGKWFRWTIEKTADWNWSNHSRANEPMFTIFDSGESPELPEGLRRFWRETPSTDPRSDSTKALEPAFVSETKFADDQGPSLLSTTAKTPVPTDQGITGSFEKRERLEPQQEVPGGLRPTIGVGDAFGLPDSAPELTVDQSNPPVNQGTLPLTDANAQGGRQTGVALSPYYGEPFDETKAIIRFTAEGPKLNPRFGKDILTEEHRAAVDAILLKFRNAYVEIEAERYTDWDTKADGSQVVTIRHSSLRIDDTKQLKRDVTKLADEVSKLENELWSEIDLQLPIEQQKYLREHLPLYADDRDQMINVKENGELVMTRPAELRLEIGATISKHDLVKKNLRYEQLFGWNQDVLPIQITIVPRGKWFRWTIQTRGSGSITSDGTFVWSRIQFPGETDSGYDPVLPTGLHRFWRENITKSLVGELQKLDGLRAAANTQWDEVERLTNVLLEQFTKPDEKGRIHWQAAHVFAQSDIRGHAADVTRHAKLALKYERDPVQRAWLYMYLGNAATVRDNDPKMLAERRADAARWYLKGYAELLPFNLPEQAPDLPVVEKIGDEFRGGSTGENGAEQVSAEVRHTAQTNRRHEVEVIRALVERRDIYVQCLVELYAEVQPQESEQFRKFAMEILSDPKEIQRIYFKIFQSGQG